MAWRPYARRSAGPYMARLRDMRRQWDEATAAEREFWELTALEVQCARMYGYVVELVHDEFIFINVN